MTSAEIMALIENLPYVDEHLLNTDTIYDFILDYVSEVNFRRREKFKTIESIKKWLSTGFKSGGNARKKVSTSKSHETFKPGTKLKIPLSNLNNLTPIGMFKNVESAKAHMNSTRAINSNSDDSEEIDVITPDNYTQWNNCHNSNGDTPKCFEPKQQQKHQLNGITQKLVPIAKPLADNVKRTKPKPKRATDHKEPMYPCKYCEKHYQQKSSLHRHEKGHHPNEIHSCTKRQSNGDSHSVDIIESSDTFLNKTDPSHLPCILSTYSYCH